MPYWINKAILAKIQDRFSLTMSPQVPNPFLLNQTVQPITDFDELLRTPEVVVLANAVDPGATGWYNCDPIPEGKRYRIRQVTVDGSAATITSSNFGISDGSATITLITWAASQYGAGAPTHIIIMDEGFVPRVYVSAYNAGDTMTVKAYCTIEDAFES